MGVIKDRYHCFKRINSFDFVSSQSLWGYKKNELINVPYYHISGLKFDSLVLKSYVFLEYYNRCNYFCFNAILNKGNVLFLIPTTLSSSKDNYLKELVLYFSLRSLQPFYLGKNIRTLLVSSVVKDTCIMIILYANFYNSFIKEASVNLLPIIYIENNNNVFDKVLYPIFGTNKSIYAISLSYKTISDSILKTMLLSPFVRLLNHQVFYLLG